MQVSPQIQTTFSGGLLSRFHWACLVLKFVCTTSACNTFLTTICETWAAGISWFLWKSLTQQQTSCYSEKNICPIWSMCHFILWNSLTTPSGTLLATFTMLLTRPTHRQFYKEIDIPCLSSFELFFLLSSASPAADKSPAKSIKTT